MDRTEEIELLKKQIFDLKLKIAMNKNNKIELLKLTRCVELLQTKIEILSEEIKMSNGQVAFAFSDLIEIKDESEVKKGKK